MVSEEEMPLRARVDCVAGNGIFEGVQSDQDLIEGCKVLSPACGKKGISKKEPRRIEYSTPLGETPHTNVRARPQAPVIPVSFARVQANFLCEVKAWLCVSVNRNAEL